MLVLVHGIDNLRSKLSSMPSLGHLYVVCFHKTHGKVMLSHTIDVDFFKCYKCDTRKLSTKGTFSTGFFTCWHCFKFYSYSKLSCNYSKFFCYKHVKFELLLFL